MEDIRLGRRTKSTIKSVTAGAAAWVPLTDDSKHRTALVLAADATGAAVIGYTNEVASSAFFPLAVGQILPLDVQHHGAMVTRALMLRGDGGNCRVGVIETFLDEE